MKITEQEKMAITTTINIAFQVCNEHSDGNCDKCPFWTYCEHADESVGYYLDYLFADVFKNY